MNYHANDCWPAKGVSNYLLIHAKSNSRWMDLCIVQLMLPVPPPIPHQKFLEKNHMHLDQLVNGGVRGIVQTCICMRVVLCGHVSYWMSLPTLCANGGVRVVFSVLARQSLVECINWGHQFVLYLFQLSSVSPKDPADHETHSNAYSVPGSVAEPCCSLVSIHTDTCQHSTYNVKMSQILNYVFRLAIYHKFITLT